MFRKGNREADDAISVELKQARAVLLDSPRILKRKVRRVAALGDTNGYALALYTLAAGHRFNWTPDDWAAVLNKLDSCDLTVAEWLENMKQETGNGNENSIHNRTN